ncbi:MAG: cytidine deaminase [Bacteroidales bacterium]|nr:cytidine deaminase [Bacteroidales bacterium]
MIKLKFELSIDEYDSLKELKTEDKFLLERAKNAADSAYAPYSEYYVGAALLLENGEIITANNQENAAYPSGLCAERIAVFYASTQFPEVAIKKLAISAKAKNFKIDTPVPPCGACRQVLAEYETKQKNKIEIILMGESGKIQIIQGIETLLPLMFHAEELKK